MVKKLMLNCLCMLLIVGCSQSKSQESFIGMTQIPVTVVTSPTTGIVVTRQCERVEKGELLLQVVTDDQKVQSAMAPANDIKQKAEQATMTAKAISKEADAYLAEMTAVYRRACGMQAKGLMDDSQLEETKQLYKKALERQQKARYLNKQVAQEAETATEQARRNRLAGEGVVAVKAPLSGIVQRNLISTGQTVLAGMPLCEIRGEGPVRVIVYMEGAKAKALKRKQQVWLDPEGSDQPKGKGVIDLIKPMSTGSMPQLAMEQGLYRVEITSSMPLPEDHLIRIEVK